jgi:hypothetical protein
MQASEGVSAVSRSATQAGFVHLAVARNFVQYRIPSIRNSKMRVCDSRVVLSLGAPALCTRCLRPNLDYRPGAFFTAWYCNIVASNLFPTWFANPPPKWYPIARRCWTQLAEYQQMREKLIVGPGMLTMVRVPGNGRTGKVIAGPHGWLTRATAYTAMPLICVCGETTIGKIDRASRRKPGFRGRWRLHTFRINTHSLGPDPK